MDSEENAMVCGLQPARSPIYRAFIAENNDSEAFELAVKI